MAGGFTWKELTDLHSIMDCEGSPIGVLPYVIVGVGLLLLSVPLTLQQFCSPESYKLQKDFELFSRA